MNILIITQYFWPENFRINELALNLKNKGHHVAVLTGKPNYPQGKYYKNYNFINKSIEYYNHIPVIRVPLISRGKSKWRLFLNYLSFVIFSCFYITFQQKKYDVSFIYGTSPVSVALPGIFLKKKKKIPILFWVQDLWPESVVAVNAVKNKFILHSIRKLVHFIYHRCDLILTTSESYFPSIRDFGIASDRIRYFPQTAEYIYKKIDRNLCTTEDKLLPKGFRIVFAGNIGRAQSVETILNAAFLLKDMKDIKWIFIGDGSKLTWLKKQIIQFNLHETVFCLGQFPIETMPKFFACADALLVSLTDDSLCSKIIPAKVQSYLACGRPILGAISGITQKIIHEANAGYVTEKNTPDCLAQITLKMHALNEHDRNIMGENGFEYFNKNFNRKILIDQLEKYMEEVT